MARSLSEHPLERSHTHAWPGRSELEDVAADEPAKNNKVSRRPWQDTWHLEEGGCLFRDPRQPGMVTSEVTFRSAIPRAPLDGHKPRQQLPGRRSNSVSSLMAGQRAEHFRNLSLSGPTDEDSAALGPQPGGKEICRYFLRTGTCGYGEKCRYEHPKTAQKPDLNTLGYPLRQGECACRFFIKNGWCGFGSTCKFHHPELPPRKPLLHSPRKAASMPLPGRYPSFGVHPQASMYQPLMGAPAMSPAMHLPQGVYPYMLMGGMPAVLPHVAPAWSMSPPEAPAGRRFLSHRHHHSAYIARRDSVSDESTSSVVSGGNDSDLHQDDYRYRMSPRNL